MSSRRRAAYFALFIMALIWGPAFIFIKPAFDYITPTQFLYFRFFAAALAALPFFVYFLSKGGFSFKSLRRYFLLELLGIPLPLLFLYEGLARTSALNASLIGSSTPIFIVLGGIIFLHEHETKREWQGLLLSLLGSLLLVVIPAMRDGGALFTLESGNALILLYNLLWALYIILIKRTYKTKPPLMIGALTYSATALIFAGKLLLEGTPTPFSLLAIPAVALAILYMGVLGTVLPFMLNMYATARIEASEASLFTYLQGILAIPFAALILHDYPSPVTWVAILLIALGVYRAEFRKN